MRNKSVSKNNGSFSSWMDTFLAGMAQKMSKEESLEKTASEIVESVPEQETKVAEININDLEKVIWNDETFYVHFDDNGADVYNEFGNVVTTLKGFFSLVDVDKELNGKSVVVSASMDEIEENLQENSDFQDELAKAVSYIEDEKTLETAASTDEESNDFDKEDEAEADLESEIVAKEESNSNEEVFYDTVIAVVSELETRLANLEEKTLQQEYARTQEIQDLDTGAEVEEQKHYEETAQNTKDQIDKEQEKDLTTPQGRVELSQDKKETENIVEDVDTVEDTQENKEESQDVIEEVEEKDVEEIVEDSTNVEENGVNVVEEKEKEEEEIKTLSSRDSKIFKQAICPDCGEKELTLGKVASNLQGVFCGACPSEYAVNLDTEEIYKNNNSKN